MKGEKNIFRLRRNRDTVSFSKPEGPVGYWSEMAVRILNERYLQRSNGVSLETPDEMCWRVASKISSVESKWEKPETVHRLALAFYEAMVTKKFMPNSPTLMNAGTGNGYQYSACYVLAVEDSLGKIFEAIKNAALIHQSGGGTGFSFSRLRPKNSLVRRSYGRASGPVSFLRVFDAATEAVKQGGKRRGANMGILRVDHPDILEFIHCKESGGMANFNLSVAVTDKFMEAYKLDQEYELLDPYTKQISGKLSARKIFSEICQSAWNTGDPGCVFLDRINQSSANPVPGMGPIEATNPCGEQPLYSNEACNLGSINLSRFVHKPQGKADINLDQLETVIRLGVRFLDDVIEENPYPLLEIEKNVKANRRIGLGVMGFADLLFLLGIPYNSNEALSLVEKLMTFFKRVSFDESALLAKTRGSFPNWSKSIYKEGEQLRNATMTTIAPTGSISIIAECSSGIEPLFALAFKHKVENRELEFVHPYLVETLQRDGLWTHEERDYVLHHGEIQGLKIVPEKLRKIFVTALDVSPEWHVRMQAAFQKHTDNGVSKTVNLPNSATPEDVRKIYWMAYELGCLGITLFREGCKGVQVLYRGVGSSTEEEPSLYTRTRELRCLEC